MVVVGGGGGRGASEARWRQPVHPTLIASRDCPATNESVEVVASIASLNHQESALSFHSDNRSDEFPFVCCVDASAQNPELITP